MSKMHLIFISMKQKINTFEDKNVQAIKLFFFVRSCFVSRNVINKLTIHEIVWKDKEKCRFCRMHFEIFEIVVFNMIAILIPLSEYNGLLHALSSSSSSWSSSYGHSTHIVRPVATEYAVWRNVIFAKMNPITDICTLHTLTEYKTQFLHIGTVQVNKPSIMSIMLWSFSTCEMTHSYFDSVHSCVCMCVRLRRPVAVYSTRQKSLHKL